IPISTVPGSDQFFAAVVYGSASYLVVWEDNRSDFADDVYMARVSSGGHVLDPEGIPATLSWSPQQDPAVAWDGENYLVVWSGGAATGAWGIYAGRVTPSGQLLDGAGFPVSLGRAHAYPKVAWNGTNFLVVWQGRGTDYTYRTYAARVTPGGQVLDQNGILVSPSSQGTELSDVTASSNDYLVVWSSNWVVYGARVDPTGTVLDPNGIVITDNSLR